MCKARDVAAEMINRSVSLAEETGKSQYYMDIVKLHKLMYLGQCHALSKYHVRLFEDKITAHHCGPYVDGLNFFPAKFGFGLIKDSVNNDSDGLPFLPLSYYRMKTIEEIIEKYGTMDTDGIVIFTKNTPAYQHYKNNCEEPPEIEIAKMANSDF